MLQATLAAPPGTRRSGSSNSTTGMGASGDIRATCLEIHVEHDVATTVTERPETSDKRDQFRGVLSVGSGEGMERAF